MIVISILFLGVNKLRLKILSKDIRDFEMNGILDHDVERLQDTLVKYKKLYE